MYTYIYNMSLCTSAQEGPSLVLREAVQGSRLIARQALGGIACLTLLVLYGVVCFMCFSSCQGPS